MHCPLGNCHILSFCSLGWHGGHVNHWKSWEFHPRIRIMRILRVFKMVRHFSGLRSLIYTLEKAYKELCLLCPLVGVAILVTILQGLRVAQAAVTERWP